MSEISGINSESGPIRVDPATRTRPGEARPADHSPAIRRGSDEVDLSKLGTYLQRLREVPGVREDLIAQVRRELEAGVYDADSRLDAALDQMIREAADA